MSTTNHHEGDSMGTGYDDNVQTLVIAALDAAMGKGPWNGDVEGDPISVARPWGVLQTNNEGGYWLDSERTHDDAIATARGCLDQSSGQYAWWPIAILDVENMRVEIVDVAVTVTTREVPA